MTSLLHSPQPACERSERTLFEVEVAQRFAPSGRTLANRRKQWAR